MGHHGDAQMYLRFGAMILTAMRGMDDVMFVSTGELGHVGLI